MRPWRQLVASGPLAAHGAAYVQARCRELFHIAVPEDWVAAQVAGAYAVSTRGRTLADEGYIHCSFADQVAATARRFYGDLDEVVVLRIDADS